MLSLDGLAERRIVEAIEAGDFDNLPNHGQPLNLDDDALIPEMLRMAYRVMRNAGVVPREISLRAAVTAAMDAEANAPDELSRKLAGERIALLLTQLERNGQSARALRDGWREARAAKSQSPPCPGPGRGETGI